MSSPFLRIVTVGVLALLAGSFIVAAVLLFARGNDNAPIQIISPAPGVSSGGSQAPTSGLTPDDLQVYINGAVQAPGVYMLRPGDRLVDAIAAAGGALGEADLTAINLARRVQDEGYYYVPKVGETPPAIAVAPSGQDTPEGSASSGNPASPSGLINLNTASSETLATLPNIGPARAQAIVSHREQNGPFSSVEAITEVSGIGPATYNSIRDLVTVGDR